MQNPHELGQLWRRLTVDLQLGFSNKLDHSSTILPSNPSD